MANTYTLGGSPLGLIGVRSRPTADGMSTFNGGNSRNVNVNSYNSGTKQTTSIIGRNGQNISANVSLFTGDAVPNFWANIGTNGTNKDTTGLSGDYKGINRSVLHNNEVYDTSILNIIEKLSYSPKAALRMQDFAYLKDLGVYPNNRLMIARRFTEPMKDNIMDKTGNKPLSVMISWKPENEDFLDFSFGEVWENAKADFTDVLNSLGGNFGIKGLGGGTGKGANILPLPGFTEVIQRELLQKLGILSTPENDSFAESPLPSGNPNIIKMAKRRKTVGYGEADSGLKCDISIKMTVEYEQKFISGIDPTIAWMDIINNILIFGTSNSDNYGLSPGFKNRINTWTSKGGVNALITDIITVLKEVFNRASTQINSLITSLTSSSKKNEKTDKEKTDEDNDISITSTIQGLTNVIISSIERTIEKYKVELLGITHALSGLPSTPWHITIGNPLRPIFCSGDMFTDNVQIKMGPTLAFNDLPSNIRVDFTLKNARPLGMQEILAKFNTGYLRSVNVRKDYLTSIIADDNGSAYYTNLNSVNTEATGGENPGSSRSIPNVTTNTTTKENQ